jgi:hypothetical protein
MPKTAPGEKLSLALLALALFALYLVTHPYRGVHGDALIYVTRAWAPSAIVEGDMLFAHEHQTALTLYGLLLQSFNTLLSVADAARTLAICGVVVWFAGLLTFTRALTSAAHLPLRIALGMAALVALAPLNYSAGSSFMAGEFLAVPRPFSEGFVLIAFACMLESRWRTGIAALLVAAAFHPLMGAAGAAVAFTWAALEDRRLWLVALACVVLALVGAGLGAPYLSNLLATFDPEWLALLRVRTSYLFLSQAPVTFWIDNLLRAIILIIAARHCVGPLRQFLIAVLVASAAGIFLSLLFADFWPSVLVTQLQPWRVLFIPAIVAPAALMLIACRGDGLQARITLALIACAFMTRDAAPLCLLFSLGALAFQFNTSARLCTHRVEALLWMIATAAWVGFDLLNLVGLGQILTHAPTGFVFQWSYLWVLRPLALPLAVLVVYFARREAPRAWIAASVLAVASILAILRYDDRAAIDISLESRQAPELASALPADDKPVLWLGLGKEPWYWLSRPNWVAPVQASSIVFSRELARDWSERVRFLIDLGIFAPEVLRNQAAPTARKLSKDAIAAVCQREDAPSAIVAPMRASESLPEGARRVEAPAPSFQFQAGDSMRFDTIASYAVWACARTVNN